MINIFPLLLNSDPQILPITGGASGSLEIRLQFETLPSAGFISIEARRPGSNSWFSIHNNVAIPVGSIPSRFLLDGGTSALRVTLVGLSGGSSPSISINGNDTATPPSDLLTDGGFGPARRIRVDNGQTGFFARRMWSLNYEFSTVNPIAATPLVFQFVIPVNFVIHAHFLSLDQGGATLRTYSADQGVAGGTFSTIYAPSSENTMTEQEAYAFQATIASGGTFTPNANERPITPLRVRTAGATAQQSSVGQGAVSEKGRMPGTYYAVIARMTGVSGDCTGVYNIVIEERP